jgi:hypothetical protein
MLSASRSRKSKARPWPMRWKPFLRAMTPWLSENVPLPRMIVVFSSSALVAFARGQLCEKELGGEER